MAAKPEAATEADLRAQNLPSSDHVVVNMASTAAPASASNYSIPNEDPPAYSGLYEQPPPLYYSGEQPPAYHVAATLPTYEEAEMAKGKIPSNICVEVVDLTDSDEEHPRREAVTSGGRIGHPPGFDLLTFPTFDDAIHLDTSDASLLGNDFVFFTAFLTSFLFNWIGFLLLMCFCHTIAARYGALAGFGLSLAKWTLIVKNSTDLASADNAWLWWLIAAFGMLVCMRAIVQYLHIKRNWRHLSTAARERLFFFY